MQVECVDAGRVCCRCLAVSVCDTDAPEVAQRCIVLPLLFLFQLTRGPAGCQVRACGVKKVNTVCALLE